MLLYYSSIDTLFLLGAQFLAMDGWFTCDVRAESGDVQCFGFVGR